MGSELTATSESAPNTLNEPDSGRNRYSNSDLDMLEFAAYASEQMQEEDRRLLSRALTLSTTQIDSTHALQSLASTAPRAVDSIPPSTSVAHEGTAHFRAGTISMGSVSSTAGGGGGGNGAGGGHVEESLGEQQLASLSAWAARHIRPVNVGSAVGGDGAADTHPWALLWNNRNGNEREIFPVHICKDPFTIGRQPGNLFSYTTLFYMSSS